MDNALPSGLVMLDILDERAAWVECIDRRQA
jgi:hypothetical protein